MNSILKSLQDPLSFQTYIDENMKTSTYKALWKNEIKQVDFCAAKSYNENLAEYNAAMVASVVAKNAERPLHQMPDFGQLTGSIGRMADEWELDNDYLDQLHLLEGKYNDIRGRHNYTQAQLNAAYDQLISYSFRPMEKAVIAPHKRLDMLYFEGLYKGTQTVSRTNNKKANVSYTFNLGTTQVNANVNWGVENASPFKDIKSLKDETKKKGRKILKLRMSENTFYAMCQAKEIKDTFKLNLGTVQINPAVPLITVEHMNTYLRSVLLPPIVIDEDQFVTLADGTSVNLIPDNRVVAQCAETVAVMKEAEGLEAIDPLPNVSYANHDGNLVGYWRDKTGYHITTDMWAQPVFNGIKDYYILKVGE